MVSLIENFILGLTLTLTLGPATIEILKRGITKGIRSSIAVSIGILSAEMLYFFIVYLGISHISDIPYTDIFLGILGSIFLFYLAVENIRCYKREDINLHETEKRSNDTISGFLIAFLNPLNLFMWIGIIGSFMSVDASFVESIGVIFGIILGLMIYIAASVIGKRLFTKRHLRYVFLVSGLFLSYYGCKIAYEIFFR